MFETTLDHRNLEPRLQATTLQNLKTQLMVLLALGKWALPNTETQLELADMFAFGEYAVLDSTSYFLVTEITQNS